MMDEGDEYVPQISQMDYNLMNDTAGSSYYEQQTTGIGAAPMQMFGGNAVPLGPAASNAASIAQQQRYVANYNHRHQQQQQQLMQSQQPVIVPPSNQQRYYMQQHVQSGMMPQHPMQPLYSSSLDISSGMDMSAMNNPMMNRIPPPPMSGILPSQGGTQPQGSSGATTAVKPKSGRKSKKAAATAEAVAAATASVNSKTNASDPRGFPHSQQSLPASYQTGFHPNNFQQQQQAMAMQQQQQRMYSGNMYLPQQQQSWDSAPSTSYPGMVPATSQQPQGVPISATSAAFPLATGYNANVPQQSINNYYNQMKNALPYCDQNSGYGMPYGNSSTSTMQQQPHPRFPQPHGTSYANPAMSAGLTNLSLPGNMMHPYYAPQQFSQNYNALQQGNLPINHAKTTLSQQQQQPQFSPPPAVPQHSSLPQHSPQVTTPTSVALTSQIASSSSHVQPLQQHASHSNEGNTAAGSAWQPQALGQISTASNVPPFYSQQQTSVQQQQSMSQLVSPAAQQSYSQLVSMPSQQQQQQIQFEQQQLQHELFECERQMAVYYQQQQRTPEMAQRLEQLQQRTHFLRSRFMQLQQQQVFLANNADTHKSLPNPQQHPQMQSLPQSMQLNVHTQQLQQQTHLPVASPSSHNFGQMPPISSATTNPCLTAAQPSPNSHNKTSSSESMVPVSVNSSSVVAPTSVSVMQTGTNQVQVSITPEPTGRTLISVYHQQYAAAPLSLEHSNIAVSPSSQMKSSTTNAINSNVNEFSIPPEPLPPKRQRTNSSNDECVRNSSNFLSNRMSASHSNLYNDDESSKNYENSPPPVPINVQSSNNSVSFASSFTALPVSLDKKNSESNSLATTSIPIATTIQDSFTTTASSFSENFKKTTKNENLGDQEKLLLKEIGFLPQQVKLSTKQIDSPSEQADLSSGQTYLSKKKKTVSMEPGHLLTDQVDLFTLQADVSVKLADSFIKQQNDYKNVSTNLISNSNIEKAEVFKTGSTECNEKENDIETESYNPVKKSAHVSNEFVDNVENKNLVEEADDIPIESNIEEIAAESSKNEIINETLPDEIVKNEIKTKENDDEIINESLISANDEDIKMIKDNCKTDDNKTKLIDDCEDAFVEPEVNDTKKFNDDNKKFSSQSLLPKRKCRKSKKSTDDTFVALRTETIKKKSVFSKPSSSRKRRKPVVEAGNFECSGDDDDQEDSDFVVGHKRKKILTTLQSAKNNFSIFDEENLNAFVEKRRSGRNKTEKRYRDHDIEVDIELEAPSSSKGNKINFNVTDDVNDSASQVANQNEWIVEKILGMRFAKRTVKKQKEVVQLLKENVRESSNSSEDDLKKNAEDDLDKNKNENESMPNSIDEKLLEEKNSAKIDYVVDSAQVVSVTENENNVEKINLEETKKLTHIKADLANSKEENCKEAENGEVERELIEDIETSKKLCLFEEEEEEEEIEEEAEQFYIKYKNRSYIHCEWKFADELEVLDRRVISKINRYKQKFVYDGTTNEEDYFNDDYIVVDRVLSDHFDEYENENFAYVKWRSLPYSECTWEIFKNVPQSKIDESRKRNEKIDSFKVKERPRPGLHEWEKIPHDKDFKDGNILRDYQVEGVNWLLFCYFNKQNCILADEMGLGKTVQTITFLQGIYDTGIHGPFLVVVPLSTLHNWEREFETWTDMNAVVYHGSSASRQIIQDYELYYLKSDSKKKLVYKFDALITTFEMVVSDCEILRKINYRVCVIDEAHRLKNRNCKLLTGGLLSFKMEHRVLLTGTPLQNNIYELFSLLNFLEPEQFCSSESFLEQFGQCQTEEQVQKLQEILKPMMLRRLKEDVEKTLQPKEETIIEIQLSNIQKKYYRAILERNFTHLLKGSSVPSLMNTMMELRKCCNHPFLINGAEEQILSEVKLMNSTKTEDEIQLLGLIQSSGKMVLIDKLLPQLRRDGHKVLIFSQMVRVLDILEEFLVHMSYPFERIDGNVRGDLRQAAIDRFSKQESERFVFLLCTRAGGLGINLTAADTVIIFDSDWNPQNDLQAQARCHRIGQTKMVKVYRLITSNTYEREMFDKASLKLGLDKAVLQSMAPKEGGNNQQLTRKEVEDLLRKGAYGAVMDEDNEGSKFSEEDIDTILQRRTQTIRLEPGIKGSTFAKASFTSSSNREDIDVNDPNFWSKWAKKANIDVDSALNKASGKLGVSENFILSERQERRIRRRRCNENYKASESAEEDGKGAFADEDSDGNNGNNKYGSADNLTNPSKLRLSKKRKRCGGQTLSGEDADEDYVGNNYTPNELAFNKSEFFKVEKLLGVWGWGRWSLIKQKTDTTLLENDMEHISRTLLLHCIREFRGDEKTRKFVWSLIIPSGGVVSKSSSDKPNISGGIYHEGWAALPEYNPPAFAIDSSFQRHVHRHANKLLARIHYLHFLQKNIIGEKSDDFLNDVIDHSQLQVKLPVVGDLPAPNWDSECDKSFLIGVYKHGMENFDAIRTDSKLCFTEKKIEEMPTTLELKTRFKRLISMLQRQAESSANAATVSKIAKWPKVEEVDYMRILRTYGVKDDSNSANVINWTRYRELSTCLHKKTDAEMLEQLYCVLAMCTKQQGGELSVIDQKRAACVEAITGKRAEKLMNRIHLMRKIHAIITTGIQNVRASFKLCSTSAMPKNWTESHDEHLLIIVDKFGLDNIAPKLALLSSFQKISGIEEKILLRRIVEICTTLETGKWNGIASTELIEDEQQKPSVAIAGSAESRASSGSPISISGQAAMQNKSRKRMPTLSRNGNKNLHNQTPGSIKGKKASGTANITNTVSLDLADLEKEKMRSSINQHQSYLKMLEQQAGIPSYMLAMFGLGGGLSLAGASSNSKPTTSTAGGSSNNLTNTSTATAAMQMQTLLAMSALGATDSATASALANMLAGIPLNTLMPSSGASSSLKASLTPALSGNENSLNFSKRKTSNVNLSLNLTSSSSSKVGTSKAVVSSKSTTASSSTANESKSTSNNDSQSSSANANLGQLSITELLTVSRWPTETPVPVVHIETGVPLAADKMPKLRNLDQWLLTHPKYTVDVTTLMLILASPQSITSPGTSHRSKILNNKDAVSTSALNLSTGAKTTSSKSATPGKYLSSVNLPSVSTTASSVSKTPVKALQSATANPKFSGLNSTESTASKFSSPLAPSTKSTDLTTVFSLENDLKVQVLYKSTGISLPMDKWPALGNLANWLDKNTDCNVHSNHASLVKGLLPKQYHSRTGGNPKTTSETSASSTVSSSALNSVSAAQMIQTLASILPSTSTSSSTTQQTSSTSTNTASNAAAISQLLAAASNPLSMSSTNSASNVAAAGGLLSGSSSQLLSSNSANLSMQNMEALQMQFLLQQLMLPSSIMTSYNPYAALLSSSGTTTSTTSSTTGRNHSATAAANGLANSLAFGTERGNSGNNNNNLSNDSLAATAATLMGMGGSNGADAATTTLLAQALAASMMTSTSSSTQKSSTNQGSNLGLNAALSSNSSAQALATISNSLSNALGSGGIPNSAASNFLVETALAAEIATNPTLLTSMLNPLASLGLPSNNTANGNNGNSVSAAAVVAAMQPFLSGNSTTSTSGLDAATMALAAFGGMDSATLAAALSSTTSASTVSNTTISQKNATSSISNSSFSTPRNGRGGLLNAVVEKLANSSSTVHNNNNNSANNNSEEGSNASASSNSNKANK